MTDKIKNHFKKADPTLYRYLIKVDEIKLIKAENLLHSNKLGLFEDLCSSIIGQQLSGNVVEKIFARFKALFPKGKITPDKILKLNDEKIRGVGTSYAKVKSLKDLALKVKTKEVELGKLNELPNQEVIDELIKVKGIGPWTAEMFLMFTLGREDVFSHGDLGLKNAIKKMYGLENPTKEEVEKIVSKWSPFKTYASRVLWKTLDTKNI